MKITLKSNNGKSVTIPIEDLIQKYWADENDKPNRIEMSATVEDETILAAMTICDEKEENYLSVDLESRNEKFDTEALWCSLEAPNTLNPFVTGYLYSATTKRKAMIGCFALWTAIEQLMTILRESFSRTEEPSAFRISVKNPRVKTSISGLPPRKNSSTSRSATLISEHAWRKPRTAM